MIRSASVESTLRGNHGGGEYIRHKTFKDDQNVVIVNERNNIKEELSLFGNNLSKREDDVLADHGGKYRPWNADMANTPQQADDKGTQEQYQVLQDVLYDSGYPQTIDRSRHPISDERQDRITIAVLSDPLDCMGIVLEGGKQCPADTLLILSPAWLTKEKSLQKSGTYLLLVHKAVSFERDGHTFLDVFRPPRRVTYLINLFTTECHLPQFETCETLELDLDCPMCSSPTLTRMIDDTLWTRIKMSNARLLFPPTLAFPFCSTLPYDRECKEISIVPLDTKFGVENLLLEEIKKFLDSPAMQNCEEVVVRPSGLIWDGHSKITFHLRSDVVGIWKTTIQLLSEIQEENVILVEAYIKTIYPKQQGTSVKGGASSCNVIRVRSIVVRGPDNKACMSKIICGIGSKKNPANGKNTIPQTIDTTLLAFGIEEKAVHDDVHDQIKLASEMLLTSIIANENKMSPNERGGTGAQTDFIGVDYVLTEHEGRILPVGVDVHSYHCASSTDVFESMNPETRGEAHSVFVRTIIDRSQQFLVKGKKVLVIGGAAAYGKTFIWPAAKDFGIEVILIDHDREAYAVKLVDKFIRYDLTDHTQDEMHAHNIIQLIRDKDLMVDGCITFWEDCGPLAAQINELIGCGGPSLRGALCAKKKSSTQSAIKMSSGRMKHLPSTQLYSSKAFHISCADDINDAAALMEFPCVMKLEFGSSAVGVSLVHDVDECHMDWNIVQDELRGEQSHPGIGLGHGNTMLLMDYLGGTEHDVDIIIYKRQLIGAFVSDNGPTRLPKFTETAAAMPTFLPDDKRHQLITAAYQSCVEVGLVSGVFNVELKMTSLGPKIIEINARMGGFYLRDWIKLVYNTDMLLCAFMIACGIKPVIPNTTPSIQMIGVMAVPSVHRKALSDPANSRLMRLLEESEVIRVIRLDDELPPVSEDRYEEPYLNIAVMDGNCENAKRKILGVFNLLGLNTNEYPVEKFLMEFKKT